MMNSHITTNDNPPFQVGFFYLPIPDCRIPVRCSKYFHFFFKKEK